MPNFPKHKEGRDPHAMINRAYFITIDTHFPYVSIINPLRAVWKYMVSNLSEFLISQYKGVRLYEVQEYSNVERSKKRHSIHIHGYITTLSNGFCWFDLNKLKKFINENLKQIEGFVRSNVKVINNKGYSEKDHILNYSSKDAIKEERNGEEFEIIPPE
jgi:hypothetical protein